MSDWDPDQYARFTAEREKPAYDLLRLVAPRPGGTAIDLGCGTGKLTRALHGHARLARTLGLDNSPAMLALSRANVVEGVSFARGDIAQWRPADPVDLVFSNAALHWLPDHAALFARLASWLAPGGQLAVQMPDNDAHPSHSLVFELEREAGVQGRAPLLSLEGYGLLLHRLGLVELEVFARVYVHVLPSRDEVFEWTRGALLNDVRGRLPADEYERFERNYRERLLAALPDERPYPYTFRRLFLSGKRA